MRGGLKGFRVFLACLMLGVASIAAVGSLASAILEGIRQNGQELLGGDVEVQSQHGDIGKAGVAYLDAQGKVTRVVEMRAMGRSVEQGSRTLIQLKAVDDAYPLYGTLDPRPADIGQGGVGRKERNMGRADRPGFGEPAEGSSGRPFGDRRRHL